MGRIEHDRVVRFQYYDGLLAYYNSQCQEFKDICNQVGQQAGYTGLNAFFFFLILNHMERESPFKFEEWKKKQT